MRSGNFKQDYRQLLSLTDSVRVIVWSILLVLAFALAPLLFEAEQPGTEVLHPVAVVIFSGLISSTLLDTFLTPAMFWLFGRKDAERLENDKDVEAL